MWQNAHEAYLESRIYSADGMELVRLLYQACISAVQDARHHLEAGKVSERSRSITRAWGILTELVQSLDRERGGEIAVRLGSLYDYMQRRLIEANLQQADGPLAEVLGLLATLSEAWDGIQARDQQPAAAPVDSPWGQPLPQETAGYSEHHWSL
jgi:flagellar protein FliS